MRASIPSVVAGGQFYIQWARARRVGRSVLPAAALPPTETKHAYQGETEEQKSRRLGHGPIEFGHKPDGIGYVLVLSMFYHPAEQSVV